MKNRRFISGAIIILLLLSLSGCGKHKLTAGEIRRNELFAEILRREDRRVIGNDGFFPANLFNSAYPEVREWCAAALGRIGLPRALPWLYEACRSGNARVRAGSAFAIGEIEDRDQLKESGLALDRRAISELVRLLHDPSLTVQMRAAEALGKVGAHNEAVTLATRLDSFVYDGSPLGRDYLDLLITALMRLQDPAAFSALEKMARAHDPEIQWRAANALVRMRDPEARRLFVDLLQSPDAMVRACAARGLGVSGDPSLAGALIPLLAPPNRSTGEGNPLPVRAAAVLALGNLKDPEAVAAIDSALSDEPVDKAHPVQQNFAIQAATALGNIGTGEAVPVLARLLGAPGPVADSAVVALAHSLKDDPEQFFRLTDESRFRTPPARRAWAQALAELGCPRAIRELQAMLVSITQARDDPNESRLVLPMVLTSLAKAGAPDLQEILLPFLASHDAVVARVSLAAYKPAPGAKDPWEPIVHAYDNFAGAMDSEGLETKVALIKGLEPWIAQKAVQAALQRALADRRRKVRIAAACLLRQAGVPDVPDDPGPSEATADTLIYTILAGARKDRTTAVMETSRGTIEIELFREDAPLTVANFVALARARYFDGLSFMRVVPSFVIQGGDPRNDQEGGPGYSIRCEINMRPYERGSVGMALAGKDTGGSQFFITLAPQPLLDGSYTCFGRVISGMQVVDRIVPGDKVLKVGIQEDRTTLDARRY